MCKISCTHYLRLVHEALIRKLASQKLLRYIVKPLITAVHHKSLEFVLTLEDVLLTGAHYEATSFRSSLFCGVSSVFLLLRCKLTGHPCKPGAAQHPLKAFSAVYWTNNILLPLQQLVCLCLTFVLIDSGLLTPCLWRSVAIRERIMCEDPFPSRWSRCFSTKPEFVEHLKGRFSSSPDHLCLLWKPCW